MGKDHTLFALIDGTVVFKKKLKNRSYVSVQPIVEVDVAVAEAPEVKASKAKKTVVVEEPVAATVKAEKAVVVEEPVAETVKAEKAVIVEEPVAETPVAETETEVQEEAPKAPRKKKTKEE
jgi:hypothetical protein